MSLMYIARLTRADILLPTVYLATKSKCPTEKDYIDLCRIFAYLKNRVRVGILFRKDRSIKETIYVDSSHGMHRDGKGHAAVIATHCAGHGADPRAHGDDQDGDAAVNRVRDRVNVKRYDLCEMAEGDVDWIRIRCRSHEDEVGQ